MSHPFEEGDYLINPVGVLPVVRHVAALSNNKFVMVIPEDIHTPFPWKLWHLKPCDTGYTFFNVGAREFARPQKLADGSPVDLMGEPQVFDVQADGPGLWRIVVPEHNLEWIESNFPSDPRQGFIELSGSEGSTKQKFTFQRFVGP